MTPKEEFKSMRDIVGVTAWHDAGFKGKGAKIFNNESMTTSHGNGTGSIIQVVCPEAEFLHGDVNRDLNGDIMNSFNVVPTGTTTSIPYEQYIKSNNIRLISCSERGETNCKQFVDFMTKLVNEQEIIINNCAYNDGLGRTEEEETIDTFYPVELVNTIGALSSNLNHPARAGYSSVGDEMDFCQFAPMIGGTSAATPFISGMCAVVIGRYGQMSRKEMEQYLKLCARDLGKEGKDWWYGWGQVILPHPSKKYITMTVGSEKYTCDGKDMTMDVPPIIVHDRTLVGVRAISEGLGKKIDWVSDKKKTVVTITDPTTTIVLTSNSYVMKVNGVDVNLDVAPTIIRGRMMIGIRSVAEAFKCKVDYVAKEQKVMILEQ